MSDIPSRKFAAAALAPEDAAAASSRIARRLLDAAVSRAITTLAHDLRNSLGVVSMQVEAMAVRSASILPDLAKIQAHANVASDHIERLADTINALIAFARGRTSSDLSVIMSEAAALVPMRRVSVSAPSVASVGLDPLLVRAVALEVLVLALLHDTVPTIAVTSTAAGSAVHVTSGLPLIAEDALEWVVQFRQVGGLVECTDVGLRLQFPPIA